MYIKRRQSQTNQIKTNSRRRGGSNHRPCRYYSTEEEQNTDHLKHRWRLWRGSKRRSKPQLKQKMAVARKKVKSHPREEQKGETSKADHPQSRPYKVRPPRSPGGTHKAKGHIQGEPVSGQEPQPGPGYDRYQQVPENLRLAITYKDGKNTRQHVCTHTPPDTGQQT